MRALISVSDRSGVADLAQRLSALGWELISSGGTAEVLRSAGLAVKPVSEVTGSPEVLGGRVKTLHPLIHAGILADRERREHLEDLAALGAEPIDLVVCNLYPFEEQPSVEMIDIGGPAMLRAAAKNFAHVGVVVDSADYESVLEELSGEGSLSEETRRRLALKAFEHCAAYDAAVARWLAGGAGVGAQGAAGEGSEAGETGVAGEGGEGTDGDADGGRQDALPETLRLNLWRSKLLRYGENPHQSGALYVAEEAESWWDSCEQLGGKEMSYLNVLDAEAAWRLVCDLGEAPAVGAGGAAATNAGEAAAFGGVAAAATGAGGSAATGAGEAAAVVVKHANPCGASVADTSLEAYSRAHACDPTSAFGGIVAINRLIDASVAKAVLKVFTEVLLAPGYTPEALELLLAKKALRVLRTPPPPSPGLQLRSVLGGVLVQTPDVWEDCAEPAGYAQQLPVVTQQTPDPAAFKPSSERSCPRVVSQRHPTPEEWIDLLFAWRVVGAVSSNAIVVAKDRCAVGIGAGQPNRRDSGAIAARKAAGRGKGGAYASDAFFPFPDGLDGALEAGCTAVISPGGSIRDTKVIAAADAADLALIFTGRRCFRH